MRLVSEGALAEWNLAAESCAEIEHAIQRMLAVLSRRGRVDWPQYWANLSAPPHRLALTSSQLERLAPAVLRLSISELHLLKAQAPLKSAGIMTLGELIEGLRAGLTKLHDLGKVAQSELVETVQALSNAVGRDGQVDWAGYARARGLSVSAPGAKNGVASSTTEQSSVPFSLHPTDGSLPIEHLQLSSRAQTLLEELKIRSIGQLLAPVSSRKVREWDLRGESSVEIEGALQRALAAKADEGRVDWPKYWASLSAPPHRLALTALQFEKLAPEVRNLPVTTLHFLKAGTPLRSAGIKTLGELADRLRTGLTKPRDLGKVAHSEVVEAVQCLARATRADGKVDWMAYAKAMGLAVVPAEPGIWTARKFVAELPRLAEQAIALQFGEREVVLFRRRLAIGCEEQQTLEQIGHKLGLTRERVRQLQRDILDGLRKPLFEDDYEGLCFRFQPGLSQPLREAAEHFRTHKNPAWPRQNWITELASCWKINPDEIRRVYLLLCHLLSYDEARPEPALLEPLVYRLNSRKQEIGRLTAAVAALHSALLKKPEGCDAVELAILTGRHLGREVMAGEIPHLARLASSVDVQGNGLYRLATPHLRTRADQAVQILAEVGRPMTRQELAWEISRRCRTAGKPIEGRNLIALISKDPRLTHTARGGVWTLAKREKDP